MADSRRILIVDDSQSKRELYRDFLTLRGFTIALAEDGTKAFEACRTDPPDLVLMDLNMPPGLSGIEATRMLREDPRTRDIPVIILTGTSKETFERAGGLRAGADDYISAPVDIEELLERIYAVLRRAQSPARTPESRPLPALPAAGPALPAIPAPEMALEGSAEEEHQASGSLLGTLARTFSGMLLTPKAVIPELHERAFHAALLVVLAAPLLESLAALQGPAGGFGSWMGTWVARSCAGLLAWCVLSGIVFMSLPFLGAELPWKRVATAAGFGAAPLVLGAALSLAYASSAGLRLPVESQAFSSGFDLFWTPPAQSSLALLARIGVIDVWSVALTVAALAHVCRVEGKSFRRLGALVSALGLLLGVFTPY